MADFSAEDIVEEMPVVDALRAFLAYLDLTDANAMDAKLHRSGRHPDDLHWSSNPRYANKAKVAGRISSTDDSALFLKLSKERDMRAKQAAARKARIDAARLDVANGFASGETENGGAEGTNAASRMDAASRSVFRAYGRYRRFTPRSFEAPRGSVDARDAGPNAESDGKTSDENASDPVQDAEGVFELDRLGWQKLVRDCAMLDNAATAADLDDLFSRVDAGEIGFDERNRDERRRRAATGAQSGDAKLEYAEFKVLLRECAKRRYLGRVPKPKPKPKPNENAGAEKSPAGSDHALAAKRETARLDAAYAALLRDDILPRARGGPSRDDVSSRGATKTKRETRDFDALLGRAALDAFRAHDASLRRVYAHYATLEMYSASTKKITWRVVEETGATLNEDEFLCFLINFDVVPHLASRDECLAVFREVELENDGDGDANEMAFPAFAETLGRLSALAFRNAAPTLRNPRADVAAVRCFKKLVSAAPRDAWELGTLGGLFRERGFFTGASGGFDLAKRRAARRRPTANRDARVGVSDWRFGPGSRAANYNRLGRASDARDPEAYEHDLYAHAHANQWTREDANARSVELARARSDANLAKRGLDERRTSPRFLPDVSGGVSSNETKRARNRAFAPKGWVPSGISDDARSPGAGGLRAAYGYQQSPGNSMHWRVNEKRDARPKPRLRTRVADAIEGASLPGRVASAAEKRGETPDARRSADRAWSSAARSDRDETTGRPWVPGSVPSYDRLRPERFNLTESFHASSRNKNGPFSFAKQTHAPVRDAFAPPVERPVPAARRSVAFDPPVERPGYDDAVGGLVVTRRDDRENRDDEDDARKPSTDAELDAADAVARALSALEVDRADGDKNNAPLGRFVPVIASPGSRFLPSLSPNASPPATQTSPAGEKNKNAPYHNAPLTDAVRIAAPGTYAYGLGTSFARPGQVIDPGVAFSRRASIDLDLFPSRPRRRRGGDFPSLPHPAVAEVADLDWFEDLRGKALRQRGLPSTKFLSTWRERLGTKERRARDEADVEAVKRGLRARLAA